MAARLKKIGIERGSDQKPSELFSEVAVMQAFNLSPAQWKQTKLIDRKIMSYKMAMDTFYQDIARAKLKTNSGNRGQRIA